MPMRDADGPLGPPWSRPLAGRLEQLVVESEVLRDNPLGDPARRPLWVYLPPGVPEDDAAGLPSIYVIQGFTGQLDMWANRTFFEPTVLERLDALFSGGDCPAAVLVFVDAWTSYGGSQFINSTGTGRYMDYLCDEVVAFVDSRYPTLPAAEHRGLTGKSSGGYGAMVVPMLRPDVFGALASHAGDALFENTARFGEVARTLRDHFDGSYEVFFERLHELDHMDFDRYGEPLEIYAYAACYSPDPDVPGRARLPFELHTGRLVEDVWAQWVAWDPVRMAPRHLDALAGMRRIYLDAGRADEYFLDLGAQAFADELARGGIPHTLELFEGKHGGIAWRYPIAIRELALALAP
jgi:enterochelin esterase-like enzyme